jgi:hypothetical protein
MKRMVAAGVQPNLDVLKTVMTGYVSFCDRVRVFKSMTTGPSAVAVTKEVITPLISSFDASSHMPSVLAIIRGLSDDLLCDHLVLGKALPLSAEGNDPELMHRLWAIGAAGLMHSKLGWPGLQAPGAHYSISKMMRERRPQGGCWALLSSLLQGTSSTPASPASDASAVLDGAPMSTAAAEGGRGGGRGMHRPADGAGRGSANPVLGSSRGSRGQGALCRHWSATGTCRFGSSCLFSHQ